MDRNLGRIPPQTQHECGVLSVSIVYFPVNASSRIFVAAALSPPGDLGHPPLSYTLYKSLFGWLVAQNFWYYNAASSGAFSNAYFARVWTSLSKGTDQLHLPLKAQRCFSPFSFEGTIYLAGRQQMIRSAMPCRNRPPRGLRLS